MSDLAQLYTSWKDEKKLRKQANLERNKGLLVKYGVKFEEKNNGLHLILTTNQGMIDFWPSTGKWVHRDSIVTRSGVYRLLGFIGIKI